MVFDLYHLMCGSHRLRNRSTSPFQQADDKISRGGMKLSDTFFSAFDAVRKFLCYNYDQLEPDEIRLLEILPGRGIETLRCRVIRVSLYKPPKFNTLSYNWDITSEGDTRKVVATEKIYLNNRPYHVAPNLLAALRFYRENYTEPLWVDYLCINQSNLSERGKQVLFMRQIYGSSPMVLVWLGDEANNSDLAIDFLERIYEEPNTAASAAYIVQTILKGERLNQWKALDYFWKRPWWMRTWVMQEQAVSEKIEVACGPRKLAWQVLYRFTDAVTTAISSGQMDACMHIVRKEGIRLNTKILHHLLTLRRLRKETGQGKRLQLLSVLDSTRRALASDDRDKIYGILSFVKDATVLVPQPDYTCATQQVYKSLVLKYIDHYKNLDILGQASAHKKLAGLPSWTPDWSEEKRISRLNRRHSHTGFFHAAGDTSASIIPSHDDGILICEGICIDTLDGLGHCLLEKSKSAQQSHPENAASIYGDGDATFSAIWRSLISDVRYFANSSFERAPEVMGHLFIKKCRKWENVFLNKDSLEYQPEKVIHPDISIFEVWYHHNRNLTIAGRSIREWAFERLDAAQADDKDIILNASFERTMKKKIYGRRLITTEMGYIGLAPIASRRGDKVCVLFGCSTPVILRPLVDGEYKFVGECYVHGIMEGEAMGKLEKEEIVQQQFALR
jgi:Heterokaryon incompatibility protein (HET)